MVGIGPKTLVLYGNSLKNRAISNAGSSYNGSRSREAQTGCLPLSPAHVCSPHSSVPSSDCPGLKTEMEKVYIRIPTSKWLYQGLRMGINVSAIQRDMVHMVEIN
jgi:hypothetical protein